DGVVFTDDMQMHAITKHYGLEDAIRLAIEAGVDIMTFSNSITGSDERTVDRVHSIIRDLVRKGVIPERRIDESFDRIMKLKRRLVPEHRVAELERALRVLQIQLDQSVDSTEESEIDEKPVVETEQEKSRKKRRR